jgi:predicted metal-dependent hydrolase
MGQLQPFGTDHPPEHRSSQKPRECLEYILVHEMTHFLEPTHNQQFIALMQQFLPKWQYHRETLNRLPVRHEKWSH